MSKKLKFRKLTVLAISATAFVVAGSAVTLAAESGTVVSVTKDSTISLPGAGMGPVISDYVGQNSGSSVELLSTTALAASLDETYNDYYDANGSAVGKYIVYKGKKAAKVYDRIPGTERVETGEKSAKVTGFLFSGDVATLVAEQGDWYQIISDEVNGYVKSTGFLKGMKAEKKDESTYIQAVYTTEKEVNLYQDPWDYSGVLCVLPKGVRYELVEEGDEFSKIYVEDVGEGWVYNDQTKVRQERRFGITKEEYKSDKKKIEAGLAAAQAIEAVKEEDAEAFENSNINIEPAPADSDDVAALRAAIAAYAQEFVGVLPYVWGSSDLTSGADCSGFTSAIYRAYGIEISRASDAQAYNGTPVSRDDIRLGDIVCYSGHVALYVGNGMVVHESVPGTTASYAPMDMMPIINITRYIN